MRSVSPSGVRITPMTAATTVRGGYQLQGAVLLGSSVAVAPRQRSAVATRATSPVHRW